MLEVLGAGVPVRSGDATFPKAMDNVTVRQGESATLSLLHSLAAVPIEIAWADAWICRELAGVMSGLLQLM
ncbi:hypothetical protein AAES_65264 [Amazona aestiva]|uniref:Uncharacterized protein n=1 Tax=Amazona aestiva TaxID=12930 RepID=A0A0Q3TRG6_AMAAE|nr:hypothetical protein AAES_65264 [Amazona aestiva]